jgi:hypothetical protein
VLWRVCSCVWGGRWVGWGGVGGGSEGGVGGGGGIGGVHTAHEAGQGEVEGGCARLCEVRDGAKCRKAGKQRGSGTG